MATRSMDSMQYSARGSVAMSQGCGASSTHGSGSFAGGSFRTGGTGTGSGYRGVTGSSSSMSFGAGSGSFGSGSFAAGSGSFGAGSFAAGSGSFGAGSASFAGNSGSFGTQGYGAAAAQPTYAAPTYQPTYTAPSYGATAKASSITLGSRRAARNLVSETSAPRNDFPYVGGTEALEYDYWSTTELPSFDEISDAAEPEYQPNRKSGRKAKRNTEVKTTVTRGKKARKAAEADAGAIAAGNQAVAPGHAMRAIAATVLVVCLTLFAFIRIEWAADTVISMSRTQQLEEQITNAREAGKLWEVKASKDANATAISQAAQRLGLVEPSTREALYLGEDTVVVDTEGNLSLSGSLAVVVSNAE